MAIKISNTTVIDDSRNLVNTGISSVLVNSLTSTDTSKALTAAQGKALQDTTVKLTGNQTVAGVKTFSSSPIAPTPSVNTNNTQVATTAFVRNQITTARVLSATAGASAGAVGTYMLLSAPQATRDAGATLAGSNLTTANTFGGSGNVGRSNASQAGTWRLMGQTGRFNGSSTSQDVILMVSVWLRIS